MAIVLIYPCDKSKLWQQYCKAVIFAWIEEKKKSQNHAEVYICHVVDYGDGVFSQHQTHVWS